MMKNSEAEVNTDTSFATKDTTVIDASTTSMKPVPTDDEKSLEVDDLFPVDDHQIPDIPDGTPPLRSNATRVPERLFGSLSTLQIAPNLNKRFLRRKSEPTVMSSRSGSRSPGNFDGGSSISSLEDAGIDTDILTDKMGFLELDLERTQEDSHSLNRSLSNLNTVSERLSEETLDDCHAFSDVKRDGNLSRGNSITTGGEVSSNILEPLDEVDDEDEHEEGGGGFKITNMEEILEVAEEDTAEASSFLPTT
jgi:hypothetical protein